MIPLKRDAVVGVHQPNFFPWLGYFAKLAASDALVLLDDVQLPRGTGSWVNRVKLLVGGKDQWVTAAISRPSSTPLIGEVGFAQDVNWQVKLVRTLESSYRKAGSFTAAMALIEPLILEPEPSLARFNARAITTIAAAVGLGDRPIIASSTLPSTGAATERLISLVQAVGGATYLSGDGAGGYQQDDMFAAAGLGLSTLGFAFQPYPQVGAKDGFVPGLSIIDALMNIGTDGVAELLAPYAARRGATA